MTISTTADAKTSDTDNEQYGILVNRRHPAYDLRLLHWEFCQGTYDGGREWFENNMYQYIKEGKASFDNRVKRAYRFNHTREVVNLLTKYVFKESVVRNTDDAPDAVKSFWMHSMLYGGNIDVLMKSASTQSSITGDAWIITDSTSTDTDGKQKKSKKQGKDDRVYAFIVKPQDMLDFAFDQDGLLSWVLFKTLHRDDSNPITSTGTLSVRYILWTKTNFLVLEEQEMLETISPQDIINLPSGTLNAVSGRPPEVKKKLTVISSGENKLGVVPAIRVPHTDSGDVYRKSGLIDDVAYLDRACANYCSNLDAIIQDQTFSQLTIPNSALSSNSDDGLEKKLYEMGTKSIFTYSSDNSGSKPEYISPDASQARLIVEVMQTLVSEIYHSIGLAGERTKQDNGAGIDNSSGVAKAYDFDRLNAMLCSKAKILEDVENQLVNHVMLWNSQKVIDASESEDKLLVKYPDSYDVRGLPDEFDIAQNLMVIEAPDTVRQEQMRNLVYKLFPRISETLRNSMLQDIKSWPVSPLEQAQQMMRITAQNGQASSTIRDTMQSQPAASSQNDTTAAGNRPLATVTPSKRTKGNKAPGRSTQGQAGE